MIRRMIHPKYPELQFEWHPETRRLYFVDGLAPLVYHEGKQKAEAVLMCEIVNSADEAQTLVGMYTKGYTLGLSRPKEIGS